MEVASKLIDDICNLMITDIEDRKSIHTAIKHCEAMGFVGIQELRQMTERGLPIVATYSAILRISAPVGSQKIKDREMSYSDLLCVIAIIAQDLMVRSQENRLNKYKNG
jgi:hypothetical protein